LVCLLINISCDKGLKPEKNYLVNTYWSSTDAIFTLIHFKEDGKCSLLMRGIDGFSFEGEYKVSGSKVTMTNGEHKHIFAFETLTKLVGIDKFDNRSETLEKVEGENIIPNGF
jgi:hypothetical protein